MAQLSDDCFAHGGNLMRVDDALALLDERLAAVAEIERVPLTVAASRILAEDVTASRSVPPHPNAAVDGYAIYFDDLNPAAETRLEVAGRVTTIVRDEGSEVEQGDVVVSIDPERRHLEAADARAGVVQARASAAEAEREAARIGQLYEKGVASKARLEQVQTQLSLAKSRRDAARALFSRQTIDGWMFDCEILALAERLGFRIGEVGVLWRDDRDSRVRPVFEALRSIRALLAIRRRVRDLR